MLAPHRFTLQGAEVPGERNLPKSFPALVFHTFMHLGEELRLAQLLTGVGANWKENVMDANF